MNNRNSGLSHNEQNKLLSKKANLERRALILQYTRDFFTGQGFLEVETPVRMSEMAPEQYITPLTSEGWFLSTSPELYMKRLLAAGYERLFQFSRCFRKGERGQFHNPEFTLLEWYRAGSDYMQVLTDTQDLVVMLAEKLGMGSKIKYQNQTIDISKTWQRFTVKEAFSPAYLGNRGWDPTVTDDPRRFDADLMSKVVPSFAGKPTMLLEYPSAMASLSRLKPGSPGVAERGEIFIGGLEIANAFSELRDPAEQERRFLEEIEHIRQASGREAELPFKFLETLKHFPECGGIALGVDRLVMLLCDAESIDDVIAFPDDIA